MMKHTRTLCAALALAFASQTLLAEPVDEKMTPAPATLTDEGAQAIKKIFPNATIGASKLNMDRGIEAWFVSVTGDPNADTVEVAAGSAQTTVPVMVMQSSLKQAYKDLPEAVAKAAVAAAGDGAKFVKAEKLQIFFEFTPKKYDSEGAHYKMLPLSGPTTAYDVTYVNGDGVKGVVRLDADGKIIDPMNWMKHAAAVVPPGKLVIRANLGCVADYTDESGVVWSADRMYPEKKGKQAAAPPVPAAQPGEIVWGGLGREPRGGRQHTRIGLVIQGTDAPFIYDSERDKEGQFEFDVPNGKYTVRVHLCETWDGGVKPGSRPFAIDIQGKTVDPHIEIAPEAGGWMKPLVKEYKDIEVTDGKLLVTPHGNFGGNDKHATIEAYEVIQQ
ncbi:MAG TPA: malectin domain-containing carbohydrate-binding protein [Chthoniobacteraceae bacterium]|nr:malectin domain-containing carbohydrate-binding protein [Chthoniobacteraceae bacterium]